VKLESRRAPVSVLVIDRLEPLIPDWTRRSRALMSVGVTARASVSLNAFRGEW